MYSYADICEKRIIDEYAMCAWLRNVPNLNQNKFASKISSFIHGFCYSSALNFQRESVCKSVKSLGARRSTLDIREDPLISGCLLTIHWAPYALFLLTKGIVNKVLVN